MKLDNLIQDIESALQETVNSMPKIAIETASDGLSLLKNRVIGKGRTANKSPQKYSGYYAKFRKNKGRQTSYKDYRFSGAMWNNIKVQPSTSKEEGGIFKISVDALDEKERKKLKYNNERDSVDILTNTQEEKDKLQRFVANKLQRILDRNLK